MRTVTPGATRRRDTTEAVRERMAHLFDVAMRAETPSPIRSSADPDPPDEDHPPAHSTGSPYDPVVVAGPGRPPPRRRLLGGLHPGLLLDRRALLGLTVLLLLAVGYAVQHFWLGRPHPVAIPAAVAGVETSASPHTPVEQSPRPTVVVDVAGKVQRPGLRTLPTGSRVADAVRAAGGPLDGTDTDTLNMARPLTDGEQILVGAPVGQAPAAVPGPSTPLNLNQATADQLDVLPGVGPALSQRIVRYRQQHGPFQSLDQLRRISGIGEAKYQDIKAFLTL